MQSVPGAYHDLPFRRAIGGKKKEERWSIEEGGLKERSLRECRSSWDLLPLCSGDGKCHEKGAESDGLSRGEAGHGAAGGG